MSWHERVRLSTNCNPSLCLTPLVQTFAKVSDISTRSTKRPTWLLPGCCRMPTWGLITIHVHGTTLGSHRTGCQSKQGSEPTVFKFGSCWSIRVSTLNGQSDHRTCSRPSALCANDSPDSQLQGVGYGGFEILPVRELQTLKKKIPMVSGERDISINLCFWTSEKYIHLGKKQQSKAEKYLPALVDKFR